MSLKQKAITGVKWSSISMVIVTIIQLAQLMILARFLSPTEFGLMGIMMVVIGFSQSFMDMGVSSAIIQRQNILHDQLSSLYWLNIFSGFVLFVIVFSISPWIANFYNEPELLNPLLWLSSVFIIVAIGNQYRILCQKELQFDLMAKVEVISSIISFIIAVWMAIIGFGVYALVGGMLAQASVSSFTFLVIGLKIHHRPTLVYHHSALNGFYSFGLYQMGERSINYISANIDKLLIGKFIGMEATGFYNMAWQLVIFPLRKINPVVNKVAFPIYAKVQGDLQALDRYYSLSVRTLSLVTVPILVFLSLFSTEVTLVMFGEGWEDTAILVALLGIVGILKALGNPGGAILLALGYANIGFWWNLFWVAVVFIALYIALSIKPDVEMVPLVLLGLSLSVGFIWHYIVARFSKIRYLRIVTHFIKTILICYVIAWLSKQLIYSVEITHAFLSITVAGVLCVSMYLPYLYFFEKEILGMVWKGKQ